MKRLSNQKSHFFLPNAELVYLPNFYDQKMADRYLNYFKTKICWQQDHITLFGKTYPQPRLTALYATNEIPYRYSGITMKPKGFTPTLSKIKRDIQNTCDHKFTTVLLNLYRDGNDSNGWHADNEKELGANPTIASLSLGAIRAFHFKHRSLKDETYKINLAHGSLLIMKGEMQHFWLHQIPKTRKPVEERINLTFRTL